MPTSSSDAAISAAVPSVARYGPAGFVALVGNMLVLEFVTWFFMPAWYLVPVIVLPIVIVNPLIGYALTKRHGLTGQVGRGLMLASASAPLTIVLFVVALVVANAVGPL